MTVIRPNSISGITSLTAHRGSINFYAHDGSAARFDNINSNVTSGVSTFASLNITGDLDVGGALTYEDVTNIDSVGVITARAGVKIPDGQNLTLGTDGDVGIKHQSGHFEINNSTGNTYFQTNGQIRLRGNHSGSTEEMIIATAGSSVDLYYDNSKKFETTSSGVKVSGSFPDFIIHDTDTTNDNFRILHNSGGTQLQVDPNNVSSGSYLLAAIDGTERLRITSTGKIGIGTDNPLNGLDILQSDGRTRVTSFGHIITQNRIHGTTNYWSIAPRNGGELDIAYGSPDGNGTITGDKLTITTDGKVGINESSPTAPLSIKVGSGGEYVQDFSGSSTKQFGFFYDQNNWNAATFRIDEFDNNGTATSRLTITDGGKVGVGCDAEVDFQVRNGNGGILKVGGSGNSATGFQIQYNNSGNTTTEILTNYRATSSNASLKLDTGTLKIATGTSGTDQLIIDSSGRILKGMSASLLGSSDVQLTGSGGPATVAGYKSDNNPTANTSMLSVTGYSQSGSTFTGIGEIDFRVDQSSNTASGYHPGSIVTRVNGGSTTGTHAGTAYSYAGLKDRERITFKSKRYYSLPEWASGSDTYNTFREEWDYQHYVGYNRYSWYKFTSHSSSSSRGGSVDIRVTWSTRHAAGNGYGHWAFHWRDNHGTGYMDIGNVYKYHSSYLSGSYYGWSSNPNIHVYEINDSGNNAGFYLRVQGHIDANSSTYDGGVMHQFLISAHTNRYGADVNKFEFVGNSTPSDVGSQQTNINIP